MPGFNIANAGGRDPSAVEEFHRAHRWAVLTLGEPDGVRGQATTQSGPQKFVFAKSLKLPNLVFDEELIHGGSSPYSIAKVATWQACEVSFYDVFGLYQVFKRWQELIWNPKDGLNVADEYKGQPQFALLDHKGNATFTFKCIGAWPQNVTHGELNYTSSDIKLLTVTFKYDYAEETEASGTTS
jgi:hypothetical protein